MVRLSDGFLDLNDETGRSLLSPDAPQGSYRVKTITVKEHLKKINLETESGAHFSVMVHRFALIGERDSIRIKEGFERKIACVGESTVDEIPVWPVFEVMESVLLGGEDVNMRIAEIVTPHELDEYNSLEEYHYKGIDFSKNPNEARVERKKSTGGRRSILIGQIEYHGRWTTVGYIELQMPLMMAKPRHRVFARPFNHPIYGVEWESWKQGGKSLVNHIVRVARVVVHPEYRGLSISNRLVKAAIRYSKERWHIAGKRALFLEISAEMLKHVDFVSRCGFHYLGDTEGNKERIAKDLRSIRNGAKGDSGIMSLQRKYYNVFDNYRAATNDSFESLQARLVEILSQPNPWEVMSTEEWLALRPLIRSPIPYYMIGLDEYANSYLKAGISNPKPSEETNASRHSTELRLTNFEIWSNYIVPETKYTRLVMDGFGITARAIKSKLVGPVTVTATPGTITFVAGSSGCGKSLLMSCLDPGYQKAGLITLGNVEAHSYTVGWLKPLPDDIPLFEHLAGTYGAERTFDVLSRVGLSEAMLFIKPFGMLSRGQRYRAMLAELMLRSDDVWLIDEFCSDLDPLSAKIVAHRLRQVVLREGRTAIVAAANHQHFIKALRPARVVLLASNRGAATMGWKEYCDGFLG